MSSKEDQLISPHQEAIQAGLLYYSLLHIYIYTCRPACIAASRSCGCLPKLSDIGKFSQGSGIRHALQFIASCFRFSQGSGIRHTLQFSESCFRFSQGFGIRHAL